MASIVLVHGAWGGSYGFRSVRPLLTAAGHDVFTPSLTGIGERSHLTGDHVDLALHVRDVANAIFYEDLDDILLLGFSYGGMVVTGALDSPLGDGGEVVRDRVRNLVYLDAFVPGDGDSAMSILGDVGQGMVDRAADGLVPPIPRELDSPEATEWSNARRAMQPVGTLTEPITLSVPLDDAPFTRDYIKATADPNEPRTSPFWGFADQANASPAWGYHEIATNHMVPSMRPNELAKILLGILEQP